MPAPDPHAIELGDTGPLSLHVYQFMCGNPRHRKDRAKRILTNLARNDWCCRECGEYVPFFRRADAEFCREGCRKKAARRRREGRKIKVA